VNGSDIAATSLCAGEVTARNGTGPLADAPRSVAAAEPVAAPPVEPQAATSGTTSPATTAPVGILIDRIAETILPRLLRKRDSVAMSGVEFESVERPQIALGP
jgi:hypothetical protein